MKIQLEWEEIIERSKIVDISFDENYLKDCEIYNEDTLIDLVNDFYNWEDLRLEEFLTEDEQNSLAVGAEIVAYANKDIILKLYKHYIKPENCCNNNKHYIYCPICGTKII